jgi:hypothetical protein
MVSFGRFACVAVPFVLCIGSLIALLVAGLAGVTDKSLFMFQVNTSDLSISPLSINSVLNSRSPEPNPQNFHDVDLLSSGSTGGSGNNVTAADLGLYDLYDVHLWGYCYTPQNGSRECTKPAFNWAETALNLTMGNINTLITLSGKNVTIPKEVTDGIMAFGTASRWTQIVFIIAYVALAVEIFFGIFANCSRAFSCVTFIVAGVATTAVCAAAALATATSVIVVGVVESTARFYGVGGSFNKKFLAAVWISAAFAIGAGFFWLFTICCCKPDHSRRRRSGGEAEKLMHGPYQPIGDQHAYKGSSFSQPSGYAGAPQSYGPPQRDVAYEPYSHARA